MKTTTATIIDTEPV